MASVFRDKHKWFHRDNCFTLVNIATCSILQKKAWLVEHKILVINKKKQLRSGVHFTEGHVILLVSFEEFNFSITFQNYFEGLT